MSIIALIGIWLAGWLFSSLAYWIWWDRELDEDFYGWSMFSFVPVIPVLISLVIMLIKIVQYAEKKWIKNTRRN